MTRLVRVIHVFLVSSKDVDGPHKAGHDDESGKTSQPVVCPLAHSR